MRIEERQTAVSQAKMRSPAAARRGTLRAWGRRGLAAAAACACAIALAPVATARPHSPAHHAPACATHWVLQLRGASLGFLTRAAAAGRDDVWAVGISASLAAGPRALAMRLSGGRWVAAPTVNPSPLENLFDGVAVLSPDDAWAVGGQGAMSGITAGVLTEHWDGSTWRLVGAPAVPLAGAVLDALAAISSRDLWAVGSADVTSFLGPMSTVAMHWNGSAWTLVPTPRVGLYEALADVARVPGRDRLWAVGYRRQSTAAAFEPLIEYWNGGLWTVQPAPAVAGGALYAVTALGPRDAWAVGAIERPDGQARTPLILHFNGMSWSREPIPPVATKQLTGVSATSAHSVWAVGGNTILHWNGSSFASVPWARPAGADLISVATGTAAGGWSAWAVGEWGSPPRPLIVARCS